MSEITEADVKAAEARLDKIREQVHAARSIAPPSDGGPVGGEVVVPDDLSAQYRVASNEVAAVRSAWRAQEEAAGRRTGIVTTTEGGEG